MKQAVFNELHTFAWAAFGLWSFNPTLTSFLV